MTHLYVHVYNVALKEAARVDEFNPQLLRLIPSSVLGPVPGLPGGHPHWLHHL